MKASLKIICACLLLVLMALPAGLVATAYATDGGGGAFSQPVKIVLDKKHYTTRDMRAIYKR